MNTFPNGTRVTWTSHTGRARIGRTITPMKCSDHHLIRLEDGLPGEAGGVHLVPTDRLVERTER